MPPIYTQYKISAKKSLDHVSKRIFHRLNRFCPPSGRSSSRRIYLSLSLSENQFTSIILSFCNFHIVRWTFLLLGDGKGWFEFRKGKEETTIHIYMYIVFRSIEIRGPSHKSRYIHAYIYIYIFPASMFYWAMDHVCATRHDAKSD